MNMFADSGMYPVEIYGSVKFETFDHNAAHAELTYKNFMYFLIFVTFWDFIADFHTHIIPIVDFNGIYL